jgi:hypothetical protein
MQAAKQPPSAHVAQQVCSSPTRLSLSNNLLYGHFELQ